MALQTSGTISLLNIQTEFGGTNPIELNEYYRGGTRVPNTPANTNIAASGTINVGSFYGGQVAFVFTRTYSQHFTNYNYRNEILAAGWDGVAPVQAFITLSGGYYISASATNQYAFTTGTFPAGSTIAMTIYGFVVGAGGAGGRGYGTGAGYAGLAGGPAMNIQFPISINNYGTIGGGGGGGGGGIAGYQDNGKSADGIFGGGGGGGGRSSLAYNAPGGPASSGSVGSFNGGAGGTGTYLTQGGGGAVSTIQGTPYAGTGGAGGTWGATGTTGNTFTPITGVTTYGTNYVGGSGGRAIEGWSNVTYVGSGQLLGGVI